MVGSVTTPLQQLLLCFTAIDIRHSVYSHSYRSCCGKWRRAAPNSEIEIIVRYSVDVQTQKMGPLIDDSSRNSWELRMSENTPNFSKLCRFCPKLCNNPFILECRFSPMTNESTGVHLTWESCRFCFCPVISGGLHAIVSYWGLGDKNWDKSGSADNVL